MANVNKVIVNGVTKIDLTSDTVTAASMLSGTTAHDKSGTGVTGSITSKAAATYTPTTSTQTIAAGQYLSGAQTVNPIYEEVSSTSTMDANLVAANVGKMYKFTGTSVSGYYNSGLYIVKEEALPGSPVGGRIFYVNSSATGATYTFYDASGNVLTDQTVSGLANAATYTVSGTGSADKFYVFDNQTHTVSDGTTTYSASSGLVPSVRWGYYEITTGATTDTIGSGKTNTSKVLAITDTSSYSTNTAWKYVKALNDNSFNGCDDWFIASEAEQDQLRSSGLVDWYSSNNIWSSIERNSNVAYIWNYSYSVWGDSSKGGARRCFACRSF